MNITIAKSRQILGHNAKDMSDCDIHMLLEQFYGLAEIIANTVTNQGSKKYSKGIEVQQQEVHNGT